MAKENRETEREQIAAMEDSWEQCAHLDCINKGGASRPLVSLHIFNEYHSLIINQYRSIKIGPIPVRK